jgi:hypothetical protein
LSNHDRSVREPPPQHRALELVALHLDGEQRDLEAATVLLEVAAEVVPAVGVGARQHADAQGRHGETACAVLLGEALQHEVAQDRFAREQQLAEREALVDVLDDELEAAVLGVEVDAHECADLEAVAQGQRWFAGGEGRQQVFGGATEQGDVDRRGRARLPLLPLRELEEAVLARGGLVVADDFADDPQQPGELAAQRLLHATVELADGQGRRG